jgi:hypothetical protein
VTSETSTITCPGRWTSCAVVKVRAVGSVAASSSPPTPITTVAGVCGAVLAAGPGGVLVGGDGDEPGDPGGLEGLAGAGLVGDETQFRGGPPTRAVERGGEPATAHLRHSSPVHPSTSRVPAPRAWRRGAGAGGPAAASSVPAGPEALAGARSDPDPGDRLPAELAAKPAPEHRRGPPGRSSPPGGVAPAGEPLEPRQRGGPVGLRPLLGHPARQCAGGAVGLQLAHHAGLLQLREPGPASRGRTRGRGRATRSSQAMKSPVGR